MKKILRTNAVFLCLLGHAFTFIGLIDSLLKHPVHTVSSDAWHGHRCMAPLSFPVTVSSCCDSHASFPRDLTDAVTLT